MLCPKTLVLLRDGLTGIKASESSVQTLQEQELQKTSSEGLEERILRATLQSALEKAWV